MTQKNLRKLELKSRRKPSLPCPTFEKTKKQRIESKAKKYKKLDY